MNQIITEAISSLPMDERIKKFGSVKIINSSIMSAALAYLKWAEFCSTKAGIKLHTKFDLGKGVPELVIVTNAKIHDKKKIDILMAEQNCIYVFDKGYVDYKKFDTFTNDKKLFVTRLKDNAVIEEINSFEISYAEIPLLDEGTTIIYDKVVYLGNKFINRTKNKYRIIKIIDKEGKELIFVTNIFYLSSEEIAWLYKKHWEIELFFKWIKQYLKIKKFIGYSLNAVMNQIISAIITFVILRLIQKNSKTSYGLLHIKRLIKHSITKLVNNEMFSWTNWLGS